MMFLSNNLSINSIETFILKDLDNDNQMHKFLDHIMSGYPVLMPYDHDFNHEPCLRGGKSAHWTVITGFAICWESEKESWSCRDPSELTKEDRDLIHSKTSLTRLWVFAKQGNSRHSGIWSYKRLIESNKNLAIVRNDILLNPESWVYPQGGSIVDSLSNQGVFLRLPA
jgi:hypothetical protein